jgi:hypothetical protein
MKDVTLHLPDTTYVQLLAAASSARMSVEQWIIHTISTATNPNAPAEEAHEVLSAALDALGFKRLQTDKARRLSELLAVRKERSLSSDETTELHALMAAAEALELAGLERLATTFKR